MDCHITPSRVAKWEFYDLKRRRAQSVRNVKATNGTISLEKYARSHQEQVWDDDEWQD